MEGESTTAPSGNGSEAEEESLVWDWEWESCRTELSDLDLPDASSDIDAQELSAEDPFLSYERPSAAATVFFDCIGCPIRNWMA